MTVSQKFEIYFCLIFGNYCQIFICGRERVRSRASFHPILRFFYNLKSLETLIGNLYIKFFLLDIKFGFNCDKSNLHKTSVKFQYILTRIVWKNFIFIFASLIFTKSTTIAKFVFTERRIANKLLFHSTLKYLLELLFFPKIIILNSCSIIKSVRIWSFSAPYFPTFGLNTERYSSPYSVRMREKLDQNYSKYGHLSHSKVSLTRY